MASTGTSDEKKLLLANLYSLRAGISLACMYKNKADAVIADGKRQRAQLISQSQGSLNSMTGRSQKAAAEKEEARKALNAKEAEIDGEEYFIREHRANLGKRVLFFALFTLAFLAALAFTVYLIFNVLIGEGVFGIDFEKGSAVDVLFGWMYNWEAESVKDYDTFYRLGFGALSGFWGIVVIILILAGAAGTIYLLIKAIGAGADMAGAGYELSTSKYKLSTYRLQAEQLKRKLEELNETNKQAAGKATTGALELEKVKASSMAILKQASAKATPYVQVAAALVAALDNAFTDCIDIRDWENLDYILYCIETKRANNMQEALMAVDRQRQTNQIVAAIESAGRELSRSLNAAVSRLENSMVKCFSVISGQLERQSRQLSAISLKVDEVINTQTMNNALLQMQNVTSMAMLGELNKISNATGYVASCLSSL